jgi:hypothetical protein
MSEFPVDFRDPARLYLDLLKKCLTRLLFPDRSLDHDLATTRPVVFSDRWEGKDWPTEAETMVGMLRLDQLEAGMVNVLETGIPGDFVETGVWRGGASILMRAVLKAYGDSARRVWLADSFRGLPHPDPTRYPRDAGDRHHELSSYLAVDLDTVKANFERYGLLDDRVCFLPGWFEDVLPSAPVARISVLRLDGDMYASTLQALEHLYPKVSPGGFVFVDDYGALPNCRTAVEDFRRACGVTEPVFRIDWTGVFWKKGYYEKHSPLGTGCALVPDERKMDTDSDFDEQLYLVLNPDVAQAVQRGHFRSGHEHFLKHGKAERRPLR